METKLAPLSASELAELAGASETEVDRMVGLGILVAITEPAPCARNDAAHASRKLPARPSKKKMQLAAFNPARGLCRVLRVRWPPRGRSRWRSC
jgi:hypothetical protein